MASTDREALIALFRSAGGAGWRRKYNWDTNDDLATWDGVKVNEQGRVVELVLMSNNLQGHIPPQLGNLGALQTLYLNDNKLDGPIPPELGNLAVLQRLSLQYNKLSGRIPPELGALSELQKLILYSNKLTGSIPPELGNLSKLKQLWLQNNELTGSIPPEVGELAALQHLDLSDNQLTGPIPEELGKLAAMQYLDLEDNKLSGSIPPELGNLSKLKQLWLQNNELTGEIPASLGQLRNLQTLNLGDVLGGNKLTGHIPRQLGDLVSLETLNLGFNKLDGHIPPQLGDLGALQGLYLYSNKLDGRIPEELGKLTALQELSLNNNQLSGVIPRQLGYLRRLRILELVGNKLDGPIPTEVVNLRNFDNFNTGVLDAESSRLPTGTVMIQVFFGYLDLVSDLYTAVSYYESGDLFWFTLVLVFALAPGMIASVFFLTPTIVRVRVPWVRRVLVATQLSLLVEAWRNVAKRRFTPILELVRLIEALFESVPQLLLQLYAALLLWSSPERNVLRLGSVCISAGSLAYNATDMFSAKRLERCGDRPGGVICACCSRLTGLPFSRVPEKGASRLNGWGDVHPRTHVWLCLLYHILEIVSRFVPLAMLALVMRKWFFLVVPYLWWSRYAVRRKAAAWTRKSTRETGRARPRKSVTERVRVKLVAMPFLDSVMDGTVAFGVGLVVTLVEFIVCLVIYHLYNHDDLPTNVRLVLSVAAISCMVGKLLLAALAIFPLRADEDGPGIFSSAIVESNRGSALAGPSETADDVNDGVVAMPTVMDMDEGKVDELERPSGTPLTGTPASAVAETVKGGLDGDVENALFPERAPSGGMHLPPARHTLSTLSSDGLALAINAATGDALGDNGDAGGNGDQSS